MVKSSKVFIDNIEKKQTFHLIRSAHGLYHNILTSENITGITEQNMLPLITKTIEYVTDQSYGNNVIKANLLSEIIKPIRLFDINKAYNICFPLNKLHFVSDTQTSPIWMPTRFWSELAIVHEHIKIHDSLIQKVLITADTIKTSSKSNPFPDLFLNLNSTYGERKVYSDIKSGNSMIKEPLKGTIGQITYDATNQI